MPRNLAELYEATGNEVASILPIGWKTAWVQVEMDNDNGAIVAFYVTDAQPSKAFYAKMPPSVYDLFKEIRGNSKTEGQKPWSTATFILQSTGEVKLEHGYDPIPVEEIADRRQKWKAKNLPQ